MNRSMSVLCSLVLCFAWSACGDDDDNNNHTPVGTADEGETCETTADCATGLTCVPKSTETDDVKFCARGCVRTTDCPDNESCIAYCSADEAGCTDAPGHCSLVQNTPWEPCGYSITTSCGELSATEPLTCITSAASGGSIGVCALLCDIGVAGQCASSEVCTFEVLGDDEVGVCATAGQRGDACDPVIGDACASTDICASLSASDTGACAQRCGDALPACATGTTCSVFGQLGSATLSACFTSDDQDGGI